MAPRIASASAIELSLKHIYQLVSMLGFQLRNKVDTGGGPYHPVDGAGQRAGHEIRHAELIQRFRNQHCDGYGFRDHVESPVFLIGPGSG